MLGGFGNQQSPIDTVEKYDPKTQDWKSLPVRIMFQTFCHLVMCIVCSFCTFNIYFYYLYLIKGITRKRRYVAAASVRSKVYVIGGYDGTARLNSVDCLELYEDEPRWHSVAPMSHRRGLAGVTVYQGIITLDYFVLQGFIVKTLFMYVFISKIWSMCVEALTGLCDTQAWSGMIQP